MPVYWHPLLAQFIEQDLGQYLSVEAELPLGEMPLRADLLLRLRAGVSASQLPYPFCFLGATTLAEYAGPEEAATEEELERLEIYGLLFRRHHRLATRAELTLWLIASRFAADISNPEGAYLESPTELGAVRRGMLDRFPVFLVELEQLPLSEATLPLLMVHKGKRKW